MLFYRCALCGVFSRGFSTFGSPQDPIFISRLCAYNVNRLMEIVSEVPHPQGHVIMCFDLFFLSSFFFLHFFNLFINLFIL